MIADAYDRFFSRLKGMNHVTCLLLLTVFLLYACSTKAPEKEGAQFSKIPELEQIKPKKPVKIKLKRSAKDEYSWELSGDDADEIIKTDRKLRKQLDIK